MAFYASLNGEQVTSAKVTIPYYGVWTADVELAADKALTGPITFAFGNVTMVGHSFRTSGYAGSRKCLLTGGKAGWSKVIPEQAYSDPSGIKASTLLRDAAAACGESIGLNQDRTIGTAWNRAKEPASRVLRSILGAAWWIDLLGVTQCQDRTLKTPIATPFTVENFDGGLGVVTIATEDPASWMPARTFTAPVIPQSRTLSDVQFSFGDNGKLRAFCLID